MLTNKDYKDALQILDACNLCGVAQSFAGVMKLILKESNGTKEANTHAIARLYAEKIMELTSPMSFENAYAIARIRTAQ